MWIALATGAAFSNALWTSLSKPVVQHVPPLRMMMLFRLMQVTIFLIPMLILRELPAAPIFWLTIAVIGVLHAARWVIILHGVKRDYFSSYGMYNTAPLFTIVLAPAMLPERFGAAVWVGVLFIIAGGMLFYRTSRLSLYGLAGAVLTAFINILSKRALGYVSPISFLFFMQGSAALVLVIAYLFTGRREAIPPRWGEELRRIAPLALIASFAGICFMEALALDTATRVTAIVRTNLLFGLIFSYVLLREKADWQWKLAGTVLILGGTVAVAM